MRCRWGLSYKENALQIAMVPQLLDTVKSCRNLGSIHINFSKYPRTVIWEDEPDEEDSGPDHHPDNLYMQITSLSFAGFRDLSCLELYRLYAHFYHEDKLVTDIAMVLRDSPRLTIPGLSLDTRESQLPFVFETQETFFEDLCFTYGSLEHVSPLRLKTLRLGRGILLKKRDQGPYLPKLTTLDTIEKLHICNDHTLALSGPRVITDFSFVHS
jgi:hypothetical protein